MPATISASGTWTTVNFATDDVGASTGNVDPNDARLSDINFASSLVDDDLSELSQFVQLVASAYSIQFWPALVLVENALQIMRNRGVPAPLTDSVYP